MGPGGAELRFAAEREVDATVDTRVREWIQSGGGQRTVASGDAGTVTFTIEGERLRVDDARANNQAGWHVVEDRIDDDGFSIALANAGRSPGIRFSAELDRDQRLELETRTRTGPAVAPAFTTRHPNRHHRLRLDRRHVPPPRRPMTTMTAATTTTVALGAAATTRTTTPIAEASTQATDEHLWGTARRTASLPCTPDPPEPFLATLPECSIQSCQDVH